MSMLSTTVLPLHAAVSGVLAAGVPNPAPVPIPGLGPKLDLVIGWAKWLLFFLGVIGLLICAGQLMIGRRNRHSMSADGAAGIPWVIGGASLVLVAPFVIAQFIQP